LIITTTNFLTMLGPQLTSRPGRFNRIIKVDPPTDEEVFELVEYVSGIPLQDGQKECFRGQGFTPDYCIEAILRSEFEDVSLQEAVHEIKREQSYVR
jgi:SpoVK/Ycf46/Vps4 family AAA+-type ATPase